MYFSSREKLATDLRVMKNASLLPSLAVLILASHAAGKTLPNHAGAIGVVGQPDFTTRLFGVTDRSSTSSGDASFADGRDALWMPDQANNRVVLRFPADETLPLLTLTTVVPKTTKAKKLTLSLSKTIKVKRK